VKPTLAILASHRVRLLDKTIFAEHNCTLTGYNSCKYYASKSLKVTQGTGRRKILLFVRMRKLRNCHVDIHVDIGSKAIFINDELERLNENSTQFCFYQQNLYRKGGRFLTYSSTGTTTNYHATFYSAYL